MRRVTALSSALAGAWMAASAGCGAWYAPLFEHDFQVRTPHQGPSAIDVETENGSIEVSKADVPEVVVDATVRARTQERADATTVTTERSPDGASLLIRVQWPEGERKNDEGCSLRISVPGADGVRAQTSNGGVTLAGLAGRADADTSNGGIEVRDHSGPVRARTSNGSVRLEGIAGEVEADTSNGGIDIELASEAAGPVRAESSNGRIRLRVGPAFTGRLQVSTSNGSVRLSGLDRAALIETGRNRADIRFGDGTAESSLRTSNGAVEVIGTP